MISVLFLIHDLGVGGAEKVLVNLVNHIDSRQFDITVVALFGEGVNEQFLAPSVKHYNVWNRSIPANSYLMKLLTPRQLHALCIKKRFDVEIAYLEGPAARVICGCTDPDTKLIGWIHSEQHTRRCAASSFRNYDESKACYKRFDSIVCVSRTVQKDFLRIYPDIGNTCVRYNTNDTDLIISLKNEPIKNPLFSEKRSDTEIRLVAVGKIEKNKGFDRLARIVKRFRDSGIIVHLYALGKGKDQPAIEDYLEKNSLCSNYTFLGYQANPYKYIAKCDLFVCASLSEGYSTAAAEALIVGTPVCTVEVSGMKEMLGENNEWGIITDNTEDALYYAIKSLITNPDRLEYYRERARERGKAFSMEKTVGAVEELIKEVLNR